MISWVKSKEIYTNPDNSFFPLVVFFNSINDPAMHPNTPVDMVLNQFVAIDLKPYGVAEDAVWADIGGEFLITGAANLTIAIRAPSSVMIPNPTWYDEQDLSPWPGGGDRSVIFDTVPLIGGVFEIGLSAQKYPNDGTPFEIGKTPAVGVNIKLKKWGR